MRPRAARLPPVVIVAVVSLMSLAGICDKTTRPTPISTTTTTIPATIPPPPNVSANFGVFQVDAVKASDTGCNLVQTYRGNINLSGESNGTNVTAVLTEGNSTRTYSGPMQSNGSFTLSGTGGSLSNGVQFNYNGTFVGTATANSITAVETLNFTAGCPNARVVFNITGTK
jgi:hypothetical protein